MGQCSPLLSAGLHHRPSPPLPAKPCSLQGLATGRSTAIRLIWKYVTFLEKMSQNYRGERWKRFIKAASPSSCQSMAAPTHSRLCSSDVLETPGDLLPAPALEGSSRALWWDTLCWLSGRAPRWLSGQLPADAAMLSTMPTGKATCRPFTAMFSLPLTLLSNPLSESVF